MKRATLPAMHYVSACMAPGPFSKEELESLQKKKVENYSKKRLITVGGLIHELQKFNPDLPVCLADWNEQYQTDNNPAAGRVTKRKGVFWATEDECFGEYIAIGD